MILNNITIKKYIIMETERTYQNKVARTIQQKRSGEGALEFADNRPHGILQAVAEPVQRQEDEEEALQGKFAQPLQRLGDEEDETLQGKFENTVQREEDDEEALQGKFEQPVQKKNETGMPDNLKAGIEDLSGFAMDDVWVHYNSDKPATVQAIGIHAGYGHPCRPRPGTAPAARGMARGAADGRSCRADNGSGRTTRK